MKKTELKSNLWRMLPYLKKFRGRISLALLLLLISRAFSVADPYVMKKLIDTLTSFSPAEGTVILGLFVIFFILRWGTNVLDGLKDYAFAKVQSNIKRFISLDVFEHLLDLPLSFHVNRSTGGVSRKISRGTSALEQIFFFLTFNILPTIVEIIFVLIVFIRLFPFQFSLVFIIFIIVYVAFTITYTEHRQKLLLETNKQDDVTSSISIDAILNYDTVRYFSNEKFEYNRFDDALKKWMDLDIRATKSGANLNIGQGLIITAGLTAILWLAVQQYFLGRSTIGDFILVTTYLTRLAASLNFLGFVYIVLKEGLANIDEMFRLLKEKNDIVDKPDALSPKESAGQVVFKDVSFRYTEDRLILQDINIDIKPRTRVALVGYSGSGKSTIAKLLLRMYDVSSGAILLDGTDIRDIRQDALRRQIGIVAQDNILFDDTIRYNIAYGQTDASIEEVERVAKIANIHEFIMSLPEGYETIVGERGVKLSGGEKQRIAIARMLIKDPCLYVFDEATASLDTRSEKIIQEAISKLSKGGRTTIVIAHRLSTIVDFDKIYVFKDGVVSEEGRHAELLAKKGIYAALWEAQSKGD